LRTSSEVFAQKGYDRASVRDISAATKISLSGLYHYFSSKEELLEVVLEATLDQWFEVIWSEVDHDTLSVRETIAFIHRTSIDYARDHPVLGCILNRDSTRLLNLVDEPARKIGEDWRRRLLSSSQGVWSRASYATISTPVTSSRSFAS
jgi:AcrR family transcriptional regulator